MDGSEEGGGGAWNTGGGFLLTGDWGTEQTNVHTHAIQSTVLYVGILNFYMYNSHLTLNEGL